jgi:hypothetical protein
MSRPEVFRRRAGANRLLKAQWRRAETTGAALLKRTLYWAKRGAMRPRDDPLEIVRARAAAFTQIATSRFQPVFIWRAGRAGCFPLL